MRTIIGIIVVLVLFFVGYEYLYKGAQPPRTVDQAAQQAQNAASEAASKAREAVQSAAQALGPAAQQAGEALREGAAKLEQGARELGDKAQQAVSDTTQAARDRAAQTTDTAQQAASGTQAYVVDGVNLGTQMQGAVGRARAALAGVTDASGAKAQLPTLDDVRTTLDQMGGKLDRLSADARRGFANLVAENLPAMRDLTNRIKGIDGVPPEVGSALDSIVAKLDSWSHAPT